MTELAFPSFLHGELSAVKKNVAQAARSWGRSYTKDATFPVPRTELVAPGTVALTSVATDLRPIVTQWRLYFLRMLASGICEELQWRDYKAVMAAFETFALGYPWGALDAAVEHVVPNSIPVVERRIEAVLSFWDSLDTIRYLDRTLQPVTLGDLMMTHYHPLLDAWLDARTGDIRVDLQRAVDAMSQASPAVARDKVIDAMMDLAASDRSIQHLDRFQDRNWLAREVDMLDPDEFSGLTGGHSADIRETLYGIDASIS
jgi:hypothetical protein